MKTPPESIKSKSPDTAIEITPKKIVLKRKLTVSISTPDTVASSELIDESLPKQLKHAISGPASETTDSSAVNSETEKTDEVDKKLVKLSVLSAKERLEMRAKKFGAPIANESLKLARAERFETNNTVSSNNSTSIKNNNDVASVDILKKRAERFGGSVSKVMNKIENLEKLQKRQERFGKGAAPNKISVAPSDESAEKARQRLERFKTVVK